MNLIQVQERLKDLPLQAIMGYANGMNPEVPPYLALGEMQRRKRLEQNQPEQLPTGTVKDQLEQQAGLAALQNMRMQQAQQQMMQGAAAQPMPVPEGAPQPEMQPEATGIANAAAQPGVMQPEVLSMAGGGIVAFAKGTEEAVDKAGRKSEKAYQLAKASAEIKRDMETTLLSNQASTNGNSSTARKLGGLQTWLATNGDFGTSGVAGASGTTTRTNGTNRTFDEATLKTVVKEVYTAGGNPKVLMVNPGHKQLVSAFTGIAAQRFMAPADAPTTIIGAADVYLSDFGTISVVPNRFMTSTNTCDEAAFVLDTDMAAVAYLRPFQTNELAKTGDAEVTQLLV